MKLFPVILPNRCILFVLVFFLAGCVSAPGPGSPTETKLTAATGMETGVPGIQRLRVTNQSEVPLHNLVVIFPGGRIDFGTVPPGTTTPYLDVPNGVYRYAAYEVELDRRRYMQPVVDWVGESPVPGEAFTYVLKADPSHWETEGSVIQLVEVSEDP